MSDMNLAWSLAVVATAFIGGSVEHRQAAEATNLGRLPATTVSVSSVNGKREQNNRYYGVQNLVDGGRTMIDGINYTTWLSDRDSSHWISLAFAKPVRIHSIMIELTARTDRSTTVVAERDPSTTASSNLYRPEEVALDVVYALPDGGRRTDRLPSVGLSGFRSFFPVKQPLERVVEMRLVFPGPSMIEVSEIEVLGTDLDGQ
jgi:hypothetical protein